MHRGSSLRTSLSIWVGVPGLIKLHGISDISAGWAPFLAKLSDIYGRRNMVIFSWSSFIGFSLACGSSQTTYEMSVSAPCSLLRLFLTVTGSSFVRSKDLVVPDCTP